MSKTAARFVNFRAVKAAVTMEQVLDHYGILDSFTRGRDSLSGPCPIHRGTNSSQFRVSISKNCWNCFGDCHCGGNVLDFVAKLENIEPMAAANRLVEWFDLDRTQLNSTRSTEERRPSATKTTSARPSADEKRQTSVRSSKTDTGLPRAKKEETGPNKPLGFQLELDPSHPYLAERGISPEAIDEFGIGFCAKGVMAQRIAIPIHNAQGELVGYAGRWPGEPPDERPKYRLPDGFRKSVEIYRIAHALNEPSESPLVIVEGFFGTFRLWQLGVRKCVALMGSSFSAEQEALLAERLRPDSRVIVMLDEDDAGRAGRVDIAQRLALRAYVRLISFGDEGFQPEQLTAAQVEALQLV